MGYYKNSFKRGNSFESPELTNLKGWLILGGLIIVSLFFLSILLWLDQISPKLLYLAVAMLVGGSVIAMSCDAYKFSQILLAVLTLIGMSQILMTLYSSITIGNIIYGILLLIYYSGVLMHLYKFYRPQKETAQ
jgi:hypothetical protein